MEDASTATDTPADEHADLIDLAVDRYKQAYESHKDDFDACEQTQDFISGDQWPQSVRAEREKFQRPCLTLDHLTQYVRHVVNTGLLRYRDIRVLAMSGDADDDAAEMIAGLIRQISQNSTAKVAYETGLRHSTSHGMGYWRVRVQPVAGTPLSEIVIHKIREPRMVMLDPSCLYPDGRDAQFGFVFTKLTRKEFNRQYPGKEDATSWHNLHTESVLPWTGEDSIVLAEYYYQTENGLFFSIMTPNYVLSNDKHHGDAMPIIRVVGDEFEVRGKERKRGMINPSSMDAQRAYNYSSSSFIENVALAPLAPWIAAEHQVEPYMTEWKDAHRVPRAVLRYKPTFIKDSGQIIPVPPPQRATPAGIPEGWQGMMQNLVNDTQMIMGLSQPNMLGTGGIPVQSGAGIEAQQEPGDVNTFHFIEHWHSAIEQTGRVILAMIPHVYNEAQVVKVMGEDGVLDTAIINPQQEQAVMKQMQRTRMGVEKVTSTSYNPMLGRYDACISTGPSSATRKSAAGKGMLALVQADPTIMQKAPDLIVKNLDIPGSDMLAKRLRDFLPPGIADDDEAMMRQQFMQFAQENQQLKAQLQEAQQIILGEREKAQASIQNTIIKTDGELAKKEHEKKAALIEQQLSHEGDVRLAEINAQVTLETNVRDNIVKLLIKRMETENRLDVEAVKQVFQVGTLQDPNERMSGYAGVLDGLQPSGSSPTDAPIQLPPADREPEPVKEKKKPKPRTIRVTRADGSTFESTVELLDDDEGEA